MDADQKLIEEQKLEIERMKLATEQQKLELERDRGRRESRGGRDRAVFRRSSCRPKC